MTSQPNRVVETVTFRLVEGTTTDAYLAISAKTHTWLEDKPGYLSRVLSRGEDGVWTDITVWSDADAAHAAQEEFMEQDFAPEMLGMIDQDSFSMHVRDIVWQYG